jgi:RNA polymerase sigma factor (sigma-70 family)
MNQLIAAEIALRTGSDRARLDEWFRQWRKPVRAWLKKNASVPYSDVDDLAQDVFLRVLRYSERTEVENPRGYLFRIAANTANAWRGRSRNRAPHEDCWLDELTVEDDDGPEKTIARRLTRERIEAVLKKLPPRRRQVLLLHVMDGMTYKQIAQHCNLSHRVVLRDMCRAYEYLRQHLDIEDI